MQAKSYIVFWMLLKDGISSVCYMSILVFVMLCGVIGNAQSLGGIALIDFLENAVHPNGCLDDYITGPPNDSTWVNFIPGQFVTGNFSGPHLDANGYDLLIETSFNRDNYAVNLLLSNGLYSDTHFINTQDWQILTNVFWAYNSSSTCNNSYSSSLHWMNLLDFDADFGIGPTEAVTGIRITLLSTVGEPDLAGVYIINEPNCGFPLFEGSTVEICQGDSFTLHGYTYTQPGYYVDTVYAQNGCDSIRFSVNILTINPVNENYTGQVCSGESFSVHGLSYNQTGLYTDTLLGSNGCDSIWFTVDLTVLTDSLLIQNIDTMICEGEVFQLHGVSYSQQGVYSDTLLNAAGCDSLEINLTLSIDPIANENYSASICAGETYEVHGNSYYQSGLYFDTIPRQSGCDSIRYALNLMVHPVQDESYMEEICPTDTFRIHGFEYFQSGYYEDTLLGSSTCDSIRFSLELSFLSSPSTLIDTAICAYETFSLGSQLISSSGSYAEVFNSSSGCDSTVNLNLIVANDSLPRKLPDTLICTGASLLVDITLDEGHSYLWNTGETSPVINVNQAGEYMATITLINGCVLRDSFLVEIENCGLSCSMALPSGFSPNADGVNDEFKVINPCSLNFDFFELSIYDRWGGLVFLTQNPTLGWNGRRKTKQAEIGVYMYSLSYQIQGATEKTEESGSVSLIR